MCDMLHEPKWAFNLSSPDINLIQCKRVELIEQEEFKKNYYVHVICEKKKNHNFLNPSLDLFSLDLSFPPQFILFGESEPKFHPGMELIMQIIHSSFSSSWLYFM